MPPIRNAAPTSPDFVRKQCSSQKPYRFICAANDPASFHSFVMCSILTITPRNADFCGVGLHRVVPSAEFAGVEENAQNLHVMLGGDAGDAYAHDEQADSAEQGMQQGEDGAPGDQSDEEQPPLRSENSQWTVHGFE